MNDTEIYHAYSEDDIIEHDTEGFGCICEPIPSIQKFYDEEGNETDEHFLLIAHRKVADELEEEGFLYRVLRALIHLW